MCPRQLSRFEDIDVYRETLCHQLYHEATGLSQGTPSIASATHIPLTRFVDGTQAVQKERGGLLWPQAPTWKLQVQAV